MSQSPPPRPETRVRLDAPTAGQGQDRGDVLVRCVLSSRTVLPVERVRAVGAAGPVRDARTGGATGGRTRDRVHAPFGPRPVPRASRVAGPPGGEGADR
ncbi:hypothetical protein B0675_02800 [Streptomyces sp. M41(2017)]|uniref:hypothetical protein n=1 Tax=Streptomyces sp. M41(2017) TaxID=1955065 RepID=UPI0009EF8B41|nr:hypothetical protein [Streptomyces sp. M41(2017)]OQQ16219.1 hypothetical protein B0675_02800 [Streptomyces sp. M41(2017)]